MEEGGGAREGWRGLQTGCSESDGDKYGDGGPLFVAGGFIIVFTAVGRRISLSGRYPHHDRGILCIILFIIPTVFIDLPVFVINGWAGPPP